MSNINNSPKTSISNENKIKKSLNKITKKTKVKNIYSLNYMYNEETYYPLGKPGESNEITNKKSYMYNEETYYPLGKPGEKK